MARLGARDMAHWLWMRYGLSDWKARRWIAAAHALEGLPLISRAFCSGRLGIDKVVELTRFAEAHTEATSSPGPRGCPVGPSGARGIWPFVSRSGRPLTRRRAGPCRVVLRGREAVRHALVALCSTRIGSDPDPDRATVVVHAQLDGLVSGHGGCELEGGPVIHPETARRLACNARVQMVVEDDTGQPVRLGRTSREPSAWMLRQLRYRDVECRFPGCGARRFTQAHHIEWWERGGRTDLDNLLLVCTFHHRLVHEYGWTVHRDRHGTARWFGPDGVPYRAGPGPPGEQPQRRPSLAAAGL